MAESLWREAAAIEARERQPPSMPSKKKGWASRFAVVVSQLIGIENAVLKHHLVDVSAIQLPKDVNNSLDCQPVFGHPRRVRRRVGNAVFHAQSRHHSAIASKTAPAAF
jgi:hypothetical protein